MCYSLNEDRIVVDDRNDRCFCAQRYPSLWFAMWDIFWISGSTSIRALQPD
jgi:hypothetical protein